MPLPALFAAAVAWAGQRAFGVPWHIAGDERLRIQHIGKQGGVKVAYE